MTGMPQVPPTQPASAASDNQMQAAGLSRLLLLFQQMRKSASVEELFFLVMNETRQIIEYDEALLFFDHDGKTPILQCISGLATFERETPKVAWLESRIESLREGNPNPLDPIVIDKTNLPETLRESWDEFLSANAVIVPFRAGKSRQTGFFLFTRAQGWSEKDAKLLTEIADNFAYAYDGHRGRAAFPLLHVLSLRQKKVRLAIAVVALLVLFWPIHETLIADMEVTPISPWIATAPIDGVIHKINVEPNAQVKTGDLLFEMDDTTLRNEYILAGERVAIAQQELRQAQQEIVTGTVQDDKKADAALLSLEMQRKENEQQYYKDLLDKSKIYANANGIAVFSEPSELEGKPVHTGESVMLIADQNQVELTISMPANDAILVKPGDTVTAYLTASPFNAVKAKVRYVSYKAQKTEVAEQFAYKIKADLINPKDTPRLGLKGTARVKGQRTTLFFVLFRKPISYVRRLTGL